MNRSEFRTSILQKLKVTPPGPRSDFDLEWQGGYYRPKSKGGIQIQFGSRTPTYPAQISATVMPAPYVIEWRNYCTRTTYRLTDEDAFIQPAKSMARLFKVLELPFQYGMRRDVFEDLASKRFGRMTLGPERPYRSPFTRDPNDWSRGYTPQPGDVSSSCIAYEDGLLYSIEFWCKELTSIEVIDIEIVAMNDLDEEPPPEIDLEKPPREFEAALELLYMKEALSTLRSQQPQSAV